MAHQSPDAVSAGAPPWHLPAPQRRPTSGGIRGFVWALWPVMSWLLPVFFVFHGFLGGGGWGTLLLMFASPIFVPAMGLLGMLPRFILRKRGHRTTPGPIGWLLFVNWWAWVAFTITMQDAGDSGPMETMLDGILAARLSSDVEQGIFLGAVAVACLSWLAVLFVAIAQPPPRSGVQTRGGTWDAVSWIAAILVPALLVGMVALGVQVTAMETDAAGDTVAQVEALPIAAQADRAEANYTLTQEKLSEVRGLIAEDGWSARDENGGWVRGPAFASSYGSCGGSDAECYVFEVGFALESAPAGFDSYDHAWDSRLRELGWMASERGDGWTDADGFTLEVDQRQSVERLVVAIESPSWWGDTYDLRQELGGADEDLGLGLAYRFDEWPPLR